MTAAIELSGVGKRYGAHAALADVSLSVEAVTSTGDETVITAAVGGNGFNGPSHFSFRVDGDRVSRMTIRA